MGEFFGNVQLPDWTRINQLFGPDQSTILHNQALASDSAPAQAQANALYTMNQVNSGTQDLADRSLLRQNVLGLAARDPIAMATAASLPGVSGNATVNSLSNMDSQIAASKLAALQFSMGLPQMPGAAPTAGGGLASFNGGSAIPAGMSNAESGGNPAAVNNQGYSGNFQFGTGRLTDLGMYQPAQGENPNGNQWAGTITVPGFAPMTHQQFLQSPDAQRMAAEIHFTDLSNQIDNTPGAQDYSKTGLAAVAQLGGVHGMQEFVRTGGKYNPHDSNGTSLQNYYDRFSQGGVPALQQSFGHPDGPLPANHPARGVQVASTGNTAGMSATATDAESVSGDAENPAPGSTVADTPEQLQAKLAQMRAGGAAAPVPAAPVGSDQPSAAVQGINQFLQGQLLPQPGAAPTATTPGAAMTSTEAVSQASKELGNRLSGLDPKTASDLVTARARQLMSASQTGMPTPPLPSDAAQPQAVVGAPTNSLLMPPTSPANAPRPAAPGGMSGQQPQGAASPASYNPMAGLPPGAVPIKNGYGMPYTQGAPAGFGWARTPDGQLAPYPLTPPVLKVEKTADALLGLDPRTNQVVTRTPITETGRQTLVPTADGNQVWINGHPTGQVIPYSGRPEQNEAYKADQKTVAGIAASAQTAQGIMPRLNEMAEIQPGLATGLGGDFRSKAQAVLEQMGADPAAAAKLTGISSAADADLYRKLATSTAGTAAKADLGANNGVEAMRIYQSANPGMSLQPDANRRITNMLRVQQQSVQDYAQAAMDHFGTQEQGFLNTDGKGAKAYTPLTTFNRQWQAQANPQVYAAATGILNGDPYEKWKAQLANPAEAARAAAIVSRIDPNAMVPVQGGSLPVRQLLAKVQSGAAH